MAYGNFGHYSKALFTKVSFEKITWSDSSESAREMKKNTEIALFKKIIKQAISISALYCRCDPCKWVFTACRMACIRPAGLETAVRVGESRESRPMICFGVFLQAMNLDQNGVNECFLFESDYRHIKICRFIKRLIFKMTFSKFLFELSMSRTESPPPPPKTSSAVDSGSWKTGPHTQTPSIQYINVKFILFVMCDRNESSDLALWLDHR